MKYVFVLCRQGNVYTTRVEAAWSTHRKAGTTKNLFYLCNVVGINGISYRYKSSKSIIGINLINSKYS